MIRLRCLFVLLGLFAATAGAAEPLSFNGTDVRESAVRYRAGAAPAPQTGQLFVVRPAGGYDAARAYEIGDAGLEFVAYLPRKGALVRVANASAASAAFGSSTKFEVVAPIQPEWKIDAGVRSFIDDVQAGRSDAPNDALVSVVVHATELSGDLESECEGLGGLITARPMTSGKARLGVKLPVSMLATWCDLISAREDVLSIEVGGAAKLLNDNASEIMQTGSSVGGTPTHNRGLRGQGQVVAVLDTGLDYDSCYFRESDGTPPPFASGAALGTPNTSRRKVIIYDLLFGPDQDAGVGDFDNQGHGTLVGGNAVGSDINNPTAFGAFNGLAPLAQLIVQDGGFDGLDNCSDLAALDCPVVDLTPWLQQAVGQGADFHNNSWGDRENFMPQNTYTGPTADMDEIMWQNPDFLIVCAAGNSGSADDTVGSPSIGKNVLSVAASQSPSISGADINDVTGFSSHGYAADGRYKPDITAPGQTNTSSSDGSVTSNNCTRSTVQGTSMASPVTAGACAILRQYYTEGWYPSGAATPGDAFTPSAALIKATLINGAVNMTSVTGPPPNRGEGWGRVHLENTLYFPTEARRTVVLDQRTGFTSSADTPIDLRITVGPNAAAGDVKVTLVWTDFAGAVFASPALVNDLDLEVRPDPLGLPVYRGNNFDVAGYTTTSGSPDVLNTVEQVVLPQAMAVGQWIVRVDPSVIAQSGQQFAVVVSGDVMLTPIPVGLSGLTLE